MKKTILFLSLLMISQAPAWAMISPMFCGSSASVSNSANRYLGCFGSPVATNDNNVRSVVPMNGTVTTMNILASAAPDTGAGTQSYVITLQKNGSSTSSTCTVSEAATTCSSTTAVTYAPGDNLSILVAPSGTPTAANIRATLFFDSGVGGGQFLYTSANATTIATGAADNVSIVGNLGWSNSNNLTIAPTNGTISKLYVLTPTAPGSAASGKQYVFKLQKNSVDTALTCTVFETATTCNDTTNSVSFVAGDTLRIQSTPTATPTTASYTLGMVMTPTIDGESMFGSTYGGGAPSNTVNNYFNNITGYVGGFSTTNSAVGAARLNGIKLRKLYVKSDQNPGAAKSYVHTVNINSGTATTLTCTRTGAAGATTCSDTTHEVTLSSTDIPYYEFAPTGTPTAGTVNQVAVVMYIEPESNNFLTTYYNRSSMNYMDDID